MLPEGDQRGEAVEDAQEAGVDEGVQHRERAGTPGGVGTQIVGDIADGPGQGGCCVFHVSVYI